MKKIPTALVRNPEDRSHVLPQISPGCEWVLAGEGVPTRKYDGTCTMLDENGKWWARREVKKGKSWPPYYIPLTHDEVTGKWVGWEPIEQSPFAKFHTEALAGVPDGPRGLGYEPGTYELLGPKIQGNPELMSFHHLISHDRSDTFQQLEGAHSIRYIMACIITLGEHSGWEGIVWHHPDGRMAKLKARDISNY